MVVEHLWNKVVINNKTTEGSVYLGNGVLKQYETCLGH